MRGATRSGGAEGHLGASALRLERLDPISQRRGTGVQASPPTSDGLSGELFPPYVAELSGALGDTSGLTEGTSVGLGVGDGAAGKALAITLRIFAIVAAFRYAG